MAATECAVSVVSSAPEAFCSGMYGKIALEAIPHSVFCMNAVHIMWNVPLMVWDRWQRPDFRDDAQVQRQSWIGRPAVPARPF